MKKSFVFVIMGICTLTGFSQSLNLSPPRDVASAIYGYHGPKIGLDDQNYPVVYFGDDDTMYVATWQGQGFYPPHHIQATGLSPFVHSQEGPGMAVSENKVYLSFQDHNSGNIYLATSTDKGRSFGAPREIPGRGLLPMVGTDSSGQPFVTYLDHSTNVSFVTSTDFGQTFSSPKTTSTSSSGGVVCECCPPDIVTGPGNQILSIFRNNNSNIRDIWATQSLDGGNTFPVSVDVDNLDWNINSCPASGPDAMVGNNKLRIVWFSGAISPSKVFISEVDLSQMTVLHQLALNGQAIGQQNFPKIAGNGDTLGIVWAEYVSTSNEIFVAWSTTGVSGLASNVFNLTQTANTSERFPDIAFADGSFHVVYESSQEKVVKYLTATITPATGIFDKPTEPLSILFYTDDDRITATFSNPNYSLFFWKLIGTDGKKAMTGSLRKNELTFFTSQLSPGMYILQLIGTDSHGQKKIFISK